jgi:lysophospholipase L1-like esterase
MLRAYGGWYPWLSVHEQMGIASECTANEEALDQVMREAAEAHGAVYVSMLDAFTGPNHDQDPAARGWLAEDGMHLSDEGQVVVLEALAAAGFEESQPPR